jgi:hypothetical protein
MTAKKTSDKKVDKVDTTKEKDETKVKPSTSKTGTVSLDPNLPLLPGNTANFVAESRDGRVQAKIITAKDSWLVAASQSGDYARVSKIIETGHGEITVEFYADDKLYASGTWPVD